MRLRGNNFDAIRLVAALHVMLIHVLAHFGFTSAAAILIPFPSVPIFFFISGYLVSASYLSSDNWRDYAEKRIRRLYPALWGATAFTAWTICLLYPVDMGRLLLWIATQATIGQDWHPDWLRGYGVGVVNGSLWSLAVEVSFYVALPLLVVLRTRSLLVIAAVSFIALGWMGTMAWEMPTKLLFASPLPWGGMFVAGLLARRHGLRLAGKAPHALLGFAAVTAVSWWVHVPGVLDVETLSLGLVNFIAVAAAVLAVAHSRYRIRIPVDISFGIFLYHMPVLNALLVLGFAGMSGIAWTIAATAALALGSALRIERPALLNRSAGAPSLAAVGAR